MTPEDIATRLLLKLLKAGNQATAGVRQRSPALTAAQIKPYSAIRNWHQKQQCEEVLLAARDAGAISFVRDKLNPADGLIERIDLIDTPALARFLKQTTHADVLAEARSLLASSLASALIRASINSFDWSLEIGDWHGHQALGSDSMLNQNC